MTREEAIERIQIHLAYSPMYSMPQTREALEMAIYALREQPSWISVTEKMPDDNEKVIVYTRSGKMCVARWSARQNKFVSSGNLTVTHWMPHPDEPGTEVRCEFAENGVDGG